MLLAAAEAAVRVGHEPAIVATCPAAPEYSAKEDDYRHFAERHRCPFIFATNLSVPHHIELLRKSGAEVAISMNWLTLLRRPVLDAFRYGVINAHAGDLPRYRGNACPNWAILNGEREIGVCLHRMDETLDSGDVFLRRKIPIRNDTYIGDVYTVLRKLIPEMFVELLNRLDHGTARAHRQTKNPRKWLRCFPRHPYDSEISWTSPAEQLGRLVRASAEPFSGAYTFLEGEKLIVWRAHPERLSYPYLGIPGQVAELRRDRGEVVVLCGKGVLVLEEVQTERTGRRPAAAIIRSTRARLGLNLVEELREIRNQLALLRKA